MTTQIVAKTHKLPIKKVKLNFLRFQTHVKGIKIKTSRIAKVYISTIYPHSIKITLYIVTVTKEI